MNQWTGRRQFLASAATVGALSVAGCSQDGGSDDEGEDEDEEDEAEATGTDGSGGDGTGADGEMENMGDDGSVDTPASTPAETGDVSFDLNVDVSNQSNSDISDFESLRVQFSGFELQRRDGSRVQRERQPMELDLTTLAGEGETDLMETTIPAGEYDMARFYVSVLDFATKSGEDESLPFENSDPMNKEIGVMGPYEATSGSSITFNILLSVSKTFTGDAWEFNAGYSSMG